jgi:CDGSH-type Zn-finger protein
MRERGLLQFVSALHPAARPTRTRAKGHAMADVKIRTRPNGPFLVEGGFTLVDSEGKEFKLEPNKNYALCRCGQSSKRPFCDGTHKTCGFVADERAPDPEPVS